MNYVFNKKVGVAVAAISAVLVVMTLIVLVGLGAFVITNSDLRNQAIDTLQGQNVTVQALPKE